MFGRLLSQQSRLAKRLEPNRQRHLVAADNFSPSKTIHNVIVDHARGLHVRIADRRADKLESALLQVFAQGIGLSAGRRVIFEPS